jgi:hypothetical protein
MEEKNQPTEAGGLPLQGPHWHRGQGAEPPDAFVPLRLRLQPGGQTVELTTPNVVLGRHTDADVRLPLPDVSRRHCRCFFADGSWQIVDLNSLNGVYLNGERVHQADLHHGDVIGIGGFCFEVDLTVAEPEVSGPAFPSDLLRAAPPDADAPRRMAS